MNSLVTFLMPTYNDESTIEKAVRSLYIQKYSNWQLIIINDGGDNKRLNNSLRKFLNDSRILVLNKNENEGQLNALRYAFPYIQGNLVTFLNSDDLLVPNSLERCIEYFHNKNIDGIFANLLLIDKDDKYIKTLHVVNNLNQYSFIDVLMRKGLTSLIPDAIFVRKTFFDTNIMASCINGNKPFWLSTDKQYYKIPNLVKVSPFYMYRISSENSIHSNMGKLLFINMQLNIVYQLSEEYRIFMEDIQSLFWRFIYKPFFMKSIYSFTFRPIFFKCETLKKYTDKWYSLLRDRCQKVISMYPELKKHNYYCGTLLRFFDNVSFRKQLTITQANRDNFNYLFNNPLNIVKIYKRLEAKDKSLYKTLDLFSSGVTDIFVANGRDYTYFKQLVNRLNFPIHVHLMKQHE